MQRIIYTSKHYCEICKRDIPIHLYGDDFSNFTAKEEPELIMWAHHYHWTDNHRVCAVCGKYVEGEDLSVAVNNGEINIHPDYTDEYKKVKTGDSFGHLLTVHSKCIK